MLTRTGILPAPVAVPVAVSWVDDTHWVATTVFPKITFAPARNSLPLIVMLKGPTGNEAGDIDVSTGTGLWSASEADPTAVGSALLVAVSVTVVGEGNDAGDV